MNIHLILILNAKSTKNKSNLSSNLFIYNREETNHIIYIGINLSTDPRKKIL